MLSSRCAVTVLLLATVLGRPPAVAAQGARFDLIAVHPQAKEQPTTVGQELVTLFAWRGRLYAGYGDYGANTGPIAISPFDPASGTFERVWLSDTEAIQSYRLIRDHLYAPATDPRSSADYAMGEPWSDYEPLTVTHAYDMVTLDGTDLWLVGSQGYSAAAWRSLDDGVTWARVQATPAVHGIADDFARYYFAGVFDNRLYLQAYDYAGGAHRNSRVFDGSSWSDGPDLLGRRGTGWRPVTFAGRMLYLSRTPGRGVLQAFDGALVRHPLDLTSEDFVIEGGYLYALSTRYGWAGPRVVRTPDLEMWEVMDADAPSDASSLAVLGGRAYIGDKRAQLFRQSGAARWSPATIEWNADPVVRIVRPGDGQRFAAPATIEIEADVTDADGGALVASFWSGTTLLGEVAAPPYRLTWTDVVSGTYAVSVSTADEAGDFANDTVTIAVSSDFRPTATVPPQTATAVPTASSTPRWTATPVLTSLPPDRAVYMPIASRKSRTDGDAAGLEMLLGLVLD